MNEKLSIRDLDLGGHRVLLRVDFNVPIKNGEVVDDSRIRASLPSIRYVLDKGGSVILMSHLGRPDGKADPKFSLIPCAKRLSLLLKIPVQMAPDCCGEKTKQMAKSLLPGEVLLLENLRFHPGEEKPESEPAFVGALAELGDLYVNDAFGTAHRAHASTALIAHFFPGKAAEGFLMEKEVAYLGSVLSNPRRPFYAILGGAKISTKFKVIGALMKKADALFIGGAMAYTFLEAGGIAVGNSLVEKEFVGEALEIIRLGKTGSCKIFLPVDLVVAREIDAAAERRIIVVDNGVPDGFEGVDIGPKTAALYCEELKKGKTIFWNGPLGVFECPPFDLGTNTIAKMLASLEKSATTIVGGGDSVAAIEQAGLADQITHISTGGGASLEYIELGKLPGIEALSDKIGSKTAV